MREHSKDKPSIRGLIIYYILSCLISWGIWLPIVLNKRLGYNIPILSYQHYLASIGPMVAAIIIILYYGGFNGLKVFIRNIFTIKGKSKWILFGLLSPILMFLIAIVVNFVITGDWPNLMRFGIPEDLPNFNIIEAILLWIITYGFGEEIGWRGVALLNLQTRIKPINAAIIIGLGWALWHLPAFFFRETYMAMGAFEVLGWIVSLIFGSIFLTWLYNSSGRSVLVTALWHALFDAATVGAISKGQIPMILSVIVIAMTIVVMPRVKNIATPKVMI